jgi:choline dehydrogenase-like flavoprotein
VSPRALPAGVTEGQTLTGRHELTADVCVIGSGAGGAVAAALLAQAGLQVLVVEEGGYFTQERFRMEEADCYPHLYQESAQRTSKDLSVAIFQGRAVGGTTVVNWTTCFRTPEATVDRWRSHHAVGGFDLAALDPHWAAVEARLGIEKIALEAVNRNNRLLYDGCRKLGFEADTLARNVRGCARTGYCGMGCPIDAKQSMLITYLPDAMDAGAAVLSRCRVERLELEGGAVKALHGKLMDALGIGFTGAEVTVRAKRFILAAGAIGSPTVLLRSGAPDPHRRTGARTFLHPVIVSAGEFEGEVHGYHGAPQGVASHHHAHRGEDVGFFLEAAPLYPLLMATALPGWGLQHRETMLQLPRFAAHIALTIDGHHDGEEGGRVEVLPSGRPALDYVVSDKIWAALREAQKVLARVQLAVGAKRVVTLHTEPRVIRSEADIAQLDDAPYAPNRVGVFSAHQMGGCGMSDDPKLGVVRSEDLRHHQLDNLHVVDGSVFPTSCGVNPQLSIYGLAHLVASRLASAWT